MNRRDMLNAALGALAALLGGRWPRARAGAATTGPADPFTMSFVLPLPYVPPGEPPVMRFMVPFDDRYRAANAILGVGTGRPLAYPGRPGCSATSVVMEYRGPAGKTAVIDVRFGDPAWLGA
jgi:hypothetical protein